jgi:putative lipoprotein
VVLGHEVRTFQPCGEVSELWLIPTTELRSAYDALSYEPYQPVFAELRGELGPPPESGFGAEYQGQLKVFTVIRADPATEGHGCAEDLAGIAFRASGNEPFWHLRVTRDSIVFSTPETPELGFPGASPLRSRLGWIYETEMKEAGSRALRFTVERGSCTDTMVGARYSLRARVELDEQLYEGCAWAGDDGPPVPQ